MGRIGAAIAAVILLIAPWASAGTFDALADTQAFKPAVSRYLAPGSIIKAEFKSSHRRGSNIEAESDTLLPERAPAAIGPKVTSKPGVIHRERPAGNMAPPPRTAQRERIDSPATRDSNKRTEDLETELEKDLVLAPPPPKPDDAAVDAAGTTLLPPRKSKRTPRTRVRRVAPVQPDHYAVSQRQVRKVRPLSRNLWHTPAGTHNPRSCPATRRPMTAGAPEMTRNASDSERFVRDGVTIKLTPRAIPASYPGEMEQSIPAEIVSAATDIIGLPFALISSLF